MFFLVVSGAAKLEVSNQGNFVILEMDGSDKLVVGMRPAEAEEVLSGQLRLALGGVLINSDHMMVPVGLFHHCKLQLVFCLVLLYVPSSF